MALLRIPLAAAATALAFASRAHAFSPAAPRHTPTIRSPTELGPGLIKGEAEGSSPLDENLGGVGLAKRAAVRIDGVAPPGGESAALGLARYGRLREVGEDAVKAALAGAGGRLVCVGAGREEFEYRGSATRPNAKTIVLAPLAAAESALASLAAGDAVGDAGASVALNFLGGDELILGEVLEACDLLTAGLGLSATTDVAFRSVSFAGVPAGDCAVTVVATAAGGSAAGLPGGEAYVCDGTWFTVAEEDRVTDDA